LCKLFPSKTANPVPAHYLSAAKGMQQNAEEGPPAKRARVEIIAGEAGVSQPGLVSDADYMFAKEMRRTLQSMKKEIEMHLTCTNHMFEVDERLAELSIDHLVATEGHFLGASSCLSASEFNARVNTRISEVNGDHALALARCNEARYIQLMMGADYVAVEVFKEQELRENSGDTDSKALAEGDCFTIPVHSTNSFICNFQNKQLRLDKADSAMKRSLIGKRHATGSLKRGMGDRKKLRGATLAMVVQKMMCFMGASNHTAGAECGLAIGGYAPIKSRGGGCINMPYLDMNEAPANMETMYARTMFAVDVNMEHRNVASRGRLGGVVELQLKSSVAWRHDDVLGHNLRTNIWD
jgi:hypothetical protein